MSLAVVAICEECETVVRLAPVTASVLSSTPPLPQGWISLSGGGTPDEETYCSRACLAASVVREAS